MHYIFIAVIFVCSIVSAALRILGRRRYPFAFTNDSYYHFLCAEEIRKNRFRMPGTIPGFLWSSGYTYPPLYHYILALCGSGRTEKYSSVIFDCLSIPFVAAAAFFVLQAFSAPPVSAVTAAFCVAAAYATSPSLNAYVSGPRAMNGTGRTLGEMLFCLGFSMLLCQNITGNPLFLIVSATAFALLFLASKFALQALCSACLVFMLFHRWEWIVVITGSFFVSAAISKGHAFRVIGGHLAHSNFYCRFLQHRYQGYGRFLLNLPLYLREGVAAVSRGPRSFAVWFIDARYAVHSLIFHNIAVWVLLGYIVAHPHLARAYCGQPALGDLVVLSFIPLPGLLVTSLPSMRFLGENYRYLEYAQWIYLLVLAAVSFRLFLWCSAIMAVYTIFLNLNHLNYLRTWHAVFMKNEDFFKTARKLVGGDLVHTVSGNFWEMRYRIRGRVTYNEGNLEMRSIPLADFESLYGNFPFPRDCAYVDVLKKNKVRFVVANKAHMQALGPDYFARMRSIADSGDYCLFEMEAP